MTMPKLSLAAVAVALLVALNVAAEDDQGFFTPKTTVVGSRQVIKTMNHEKRSAQVYAVFPKEGYSTPLYILNITADSTYDAGFAYGYLMAENATAAYTTLLQALLPDKALQDVAELFFEWQYSDYLSKGLPQDALDEIRGIREGAIAAGYAETAVKLTNGISIASIATGGLSDDILYLIENEFNKNTTLGQRLRETYGNPFAVTQAILESKIMDMARSCSMFGVFGSRTENGALFTGRNLDWAGDTGIAIFKLMTVYHIKGQVPYAMFGYAGLVTAMTGMSAKGITVHEAGNDNKLVTLSEGYAWGLRLRALMAEATDLDSARKFWERTNNTMGLNHGIGSAADNKFLALETRAGYTAYFADNDPREANFVYNGKHMGFPLQDAVWRTNHGYDPKFLETAIDKHPPTDSYNRYLLLHDAFESYREEGVKVSDFQAVNLTAIVGDKGGSERSSFLTCDHATDGINVLSVTFVPKTDGTGTIYVAYEDGRHSNHVPACCGYYIKLDMAEYFGVQ